MKRFVALTTMLCMLLSLVACSTGTPSSSAAASSAPAASTAAAASASVSAEATATPPVADGPLAAYKEKITVTVPGSVGANVFYAAGENFEENFVTNFYREKLNLDYRAKWMVDPSQAAEKLNLAISTNDLPDMFEVADPVMLGKLHAAGQIADLTQYYDQYASPELKPILEYQDKRGFLTSTFDGKLFGLPVSNDFANNLPMLYIRKDWLSTAGLAEPKTLDELINVARVFRDKGLGSKGGKGTIAMTKTFGSNGYTIKIVGNALGAFYDIWVPDGKGGLKYGSVQPEMKETLKKLQEMYKEGLFDPEFAVKDDNKIAEDVAAGKIGIYPGVFWSPLWPLAGSLDKDPKADWIALPAMQNKDGKSIAQNTIFAYSWVVVRTGFAHPEAIYKSMNLWYEMFHGQYADKFNDMLSTDKYKPTADNWHTNAKPVFFSNPEKNLMLSANYLEAKKANDPSLLKTGEARNRWALYKAGGSQGWAHDTFLSVSEPTLKKYDGFQYNEFLGTPTETMSMRMPNLNKIEYETFAAIIMGDPIDKFDEFVNNWNAQGGADITKEVSAWYASVKK